MGGRLRPPPIPPLRPFLLCVKDPVSEKGQVDDSESLRGGKL